MMRELRINHLAVWTAIVIILAFLYIWYNYIFFDQWLEANKITAEYFEERQGYIPYLVSFITTVLIVHLLAWIYAQLKIDSVPAGMSIALIIGFAFTFLNVLGQDLYAFRPFLISFIDGFANLISCVIAGGILGGWRSYEPE